MLNIIKMDLYRMLKTKSMYVIWIVLAAILLITTSLCKTDYELLTEKDAMKQEQVTEPTVDNLNVGMMVTLPTEPGKKVTVYDIFFANSQGKLYALLLVIFTVLFSTADISSGYIKNIGGQVRNRGILNFQIYKYTITGKLSLLPMNPSGNECLAAFGVAIVFIVMMISVSSVVFQKRDI